jgi:hypothetical protein
MQLNISNKSIVDLAKIFSPTIIKELSINGNSEKLTRVLKELELLSQLDLKKDLSSFFNDVYNFLLKNYRNEYIYKNTIIKKVLLGKHSLNTAYLINECRVGNSKADSVILNGTSTVYEIKSEFDTFNRLDTQLNDYKKAFEFIYIVIPSQSLEKLKLYLNDNDVGIIVLNKRNTLSIIQEAKSNKTHFDKKIIFELLRKKEYINIIKKYYGNIPNMPNTKIFTYCKNLFYKLDIELIHSEIISTLKKRGENNIYKEFILSVPESLKALSIQVNFTQKEKQNLLYVLKKEMKYII